MQFKLIIDKEQDEQIVATVHDRSGLTDAIEAPVLHHAGADRIPVYTEDDMKMLAFSQIECVTVLEGKTYAIDLKNRHCQPLLSR